MLLKSMLILGGFKPGALENFYKCGFEKCGITVDTCDIADQYNAFLQKSMLNKVINKITPDIFYRDINERLLRFLHKKKYDVILVFKGMELFPETVKQLKDHAVITANYNADHPFIFFFPGSGNRHVLNGIPHFDVHFSYAFNIVQQLRMRFNKQAYCIPFGYNSHINVSKDNTSNVYVDKFLFIGIFDNERGRYLNQLKSEWLDIYGDTKWKSRNLFRPYIRKAYQNRALYNDDYAQAVKSSLGVLNLLRQQNIMEDSHNMRTFEVPWYGGLLISQRTGEQLNFFEENKEAVFYSSIDELKEKLSYLATHPAIVHSMKQAAYDRSVRSNYSYDERSRQLLQCLNNFF